MEQRSGYGVDSMSVEPQEVEITTGDKTLAEIDRVVAIVNQMILLAIRSRWMNDRGLG